MAWLALFERFAREHYDSIPQSVGVLGASPLDLGCLDPGALIAAFTQAGAQKVVVHGLGFSLTELQAASKLARNIVLSPAGFAAAKLLRERFQTPYTFDYPLLSETFCQKAAMGNNILIIHQQVAAHVLREKIRALNPKARITCASFFMQLPELLEAGDQHLEGEAQLKNLLLQEGFDLIVADSMLMRGISPASTNALLDFPHFAVSGRLS